VKKVGLWGYIKAAFNARPIGMFVPPNWVGIVAIALVGLINPGFWAIGAGLELAYLYVVSTNKRFQRFIDAKQMLGEQQEWQQKLGAMLTDLSADAQDQYRELARRCQRILEQQTGTLTTDNDLQLQGQGLGRLLWIYLRLLRTRQAIEHVLHDSPSVDLDPLERRRARLEKQLRSESLLEDLRRSLTGQMEILDQRIAKRNEARRKLEFLNAELERIEEQVELIREQAAVSTDSHALSERIDQITGTLGQTSQWIREQQQIYGQVEDLLTEPPAVELPAAARATARGSQ
jgi:hypothetical protein